MGNDNDIVNKFKPLTPEEEIQVVKRNNEINKKLIINDAQLEAEIDLFNTIEDIVVNPKTGNVMAVIKRPTMEQLDILTGKNFRKYKNIEDIPIELQETENKKILETFSEIITKPKHDAEWWNQHLTIDLIEAIKKTIEETIKTLGNLSGNF